MNTSCLLCADTEDRDDMVEKRTDWLNQAPATTVTLQQVC